ncbi:SRPBCC domain-containing protein [Flavobacterium faecale]|uniref:SRPBCC domain-containing protein n=1 Tax=Flavobacterium faecale TaxID=1355330 RepID=UPI003AAF202B
MKKIQFSSKINSPKENVWKTLWNDDSYRKWTAVFSPDSHAESDWELGSSIKFLDANGNGIYSIIETKIPFEQMSFKHLGEIKNGVETTTDWAGVMEEYFLKEKDGITELRMEMDIREEFESYFTNTFPKAIQLIKEISEKN